MFVKCLYFALRLSLDQNCNFSHLFVMTAPHSGLYISTTTFVLRTLYFSDLLMRSLEKKNLSESKVWHINPNICVSHTDNDTDLLFGKITRHFVKQVHRFVCSDCVNESLTQSTSVSLLPVFVFLICATV